ncbi:GAF domain-containing protein [Microbacterium insulae]|uniref:GAF domain-containing protein n=1 Tax=Microbacterium insulae TaxID=483014 RepID=A0ABW3AE61_9MICO
MTTDDEPDLPDVSRLEADEALAALLAQAEKVRHVQDRLRALLSATRAVVEHSDLSTVLRRIVEAAIELVDAEYGALGVIAPEGDRLEQFIYVGLSAAEAEQIGHLPSGKGLLGALIADPHPIRLARMSDDERAVGFPDHHPAMTSFLGVPLRVRGEAFGNLYLTNSRHGGFTAEDERLAGALAVTAGFAVDNARLLEEARTRERWMTSAAELSAALLSTPTDTAFDLIAGRTFDLADVDRVTVLLGEDPREPLRVAASRGADEAELRGALVDASRVCAGVALAADSTHALGRDEEGAADPLRLSADGAVGPALVAPLRTQSRLWGAVCLARAPHRPHFTRAESESIGDYVSRAAIALELAIAREEGQRAMLADDRRRIARDLHDHVIQQLFGTGLTLQAVASTLPAGGSADRLADSIDQLDSAISQIRTVVFALSQRDDVSVRHHVLDVVADLSAAVRHPPAIRFTGPVDHSITGDLSSEVVGVARELLSNAVRHSNADRISVEVAVDGGSALVTVEDDGNGIADDVTRSGLDNLEHRARRRGGALTIATGGAGTRATWRVPLEPSPAPPRGDGR